MSNVDFRAAVGTLFDTGWASATPIAWQGRSFEPAKDDTSWVRLSILESDTFQHEIGSTNVQQREVGLVMVQVFTQVDKGDGPALTLADSVATIFRRQNVLYTNGRAIFRIPRVRVIGIDGSGATAWFQVNVSVPYIRDTWF